MDHGLTPVDRALVQELMFRGWYREGAAPPDDTGRPGWRFRSGHTLEDPHRHTLVVHADSARSAMQAVLAQLQQQAPPHSG